ncbi:MAG TPA: hypothetical protein VN739_08350 [Nitrososphaerales archaeon]|nr:hypothetical protein [Nitrososphaerales archaeon]
MLICDRCKRPIVGESKKLLDVCPDCYDQVMNYIVAGTPNYGISQARIVARIGKKFSSKVVAIIVILLVLLSFTSYFAYYTYSQYEAPLQTEKQLVNALQRNLTQEQSTVQTAATLILTYRAANTNLTNQVESLNQNLI